MRNTSGRSNRIWAFLLVLTMSKVTMAQEKTDGPHIPLEKNLDKAWVTSLTEKGAQKIYMGQELESIAMPCGGIGSGQVEVMGDGRLSFTESIYNQRQQSNAGHGLSTGYQYLNPQEIVTKIENGFSIVVRPEGEAAKSYELSGSDFDDIRFIGEYPIAQIDYKKKGGDLPLSIRSEVFSPFIPLDVRNSSNPVTVLRYTVENESASPIEVSFVGHLKNTDFPHAGSIKQVNTLKKAKGVTGISFEMEAQSDIDSILKHSRLGGLSLSVLDENAQYSLEDSGGEHLQKLLEGKHINSEGTKKANDTAISGSLSSTVTLAPNESKTFTFMVSWYFPNYYENGKRYKQASTEAPGMVGHIYNNWYSSAFDVATYVAANFEMLYDGTTDFRNTYHDTSLPYWLVSRISMPLSTLAAGNIAIWENGRLYGYEGIGFCQGTCGHVYNFVVTISKLFPELERSVRLNQDFSSEGPYSGFSKSGRINFRGYGVDDPNAIHSYASDAQSGYILKAYREHLMSPDNSFLETIWPKVKKAIGYHIFKDGAEIGLEPNGVLEGKQTFWDPMWYGPNPYNNTLYLAALRAAEEMAKIMGEPELGKRYHSLFESGQQYMNEKMWNGEYYVHLYPIGFKGDEGVRNGFSTPEIIDSNAERFIEAFNNGEPNYFVGTGCDSQQLFGQNWASQLGLGHILPIENCKLAANSIFKYNFTPDIATVYEFTKPKYRVLAASGESAMVNGSWPKDPPKEFENVHDKTDIWTGLEYEASCNMINMGLLEEALIIIKSIHERYDAKKRNPWNEIEGSDHYSRAMQAWNVLLALGGYTHDGPAGKLGFAPNIAPNDFKSFFSASEGWGTLVQHQNGKEQHNSIKLKRGKLRVKTLELELKEGLTAKRVKMVLNGNSVTGISFEQEGNQLTIGFPEQTVQKDQELEIAIKTK